MSNSAGLVSTDGVSTVEDYLDIAERLGVGHSTATSVLLLSTLAEVRQLVAEMTDDNMADALVRRSMANAISRMSQPPRLRILS